MPSPPSRPPVRPAKPVKLRWDTKPVRRPRPNAAPSKGALERDEGEERIAKLLARAGVASRREIERMIADGRITLNGEKIETPATLLKTLHGVAVDGKAVGQPAPTQLYLFHKPEGCLTAERDIRCAAQRLAAIDADRSARSQYRRAVAAHQ